MSELKEYPYCESLPVLFQANVAHKGCTLKLSVVECDNDDDCSALPFIEHSLCVYGVDDKQAIERWNKAVTQK